MLFLLSENNSGGYMMTTTNIFTQHEEQLQLQQALATLREAARMKTRILKGTVYGVETLTLVGHKQQVLAVDFNGIFGYIPASKIDNYDFKGLQAFVGTEFDFVVEELFIPSELETDNDEIEEAPNNATEAIVESNPEITLSEEYEQKTISVDAADTLVSEEPSQLTEQKNSKHSKHDSSTIKQTRFIGNRAAALEIQSNRFWKSLQTKGVSNQIYDAFVSGVDKVNVWLVVEGMRVRMNRMNFSYKFIDDLRNELYIGDMIKVKVLSFEEKEVDGNKVRNLEVSRKVLEKDPKEFLHNIKVKGTYLGVVKNIDIDNGVFVELQTFGITVLTSFPSMDSGIKLQKEKQVNVRVTKINTETGFVHGVIFDPRSGRRPRRD
ncbi:hypothetical protein Bsph_p004 (plasmid) [Lysinibacillus sphaericus C3-41]|uniref:S1 motif domain-containing protein n=2 Tax=Bacillaceae TaxID=186817 RepID=B1I075_LYSSC|nr:hypothetical protein Bsph_p004 [Lysinibacillus sphaericus C3-41]